MLALVVHSFSVYTLPNPKTFLYSKSAIEALEKDGNMSVVLHLHIFHIFLY